MEVGGTCNSWAMTGRYRRSLGQRQVPLTNFRRSPNPVQLEWVCEDDNAREDVVYGPWIVGLDCCEREHTAISGRIDPYVY